MKRVTAVPDVESRFELELDHGTAIVDAITVLVLWDDSAKGQPLDVRYTALKANLEKYFGQPITLGTTYLVLDTAVNLITDLKKTHIVSASLKSSESVPTEVPPN